MNFLKYIYILCLCIGCCFSAQAQTLNMGVSAPEDGTWNLITNPDTDLQKITYSVRRGHPEGRIRQFMKTYSVPNKAHPPTRNLLYYKQIKRKGVHRLDIFITRMENMPLNKMNETETLAYWINLHNVLAVRAIATETKSNTLSKLRGNPTISGKLWTKKRITIQGESLSIEDIELHKIIAKSQNPNIVYALYQGIAGGPTLPSSGFTSSGLTQQLETVASAFINSKPAITIRDHEIVLSPIFFWYKDHFFKTDESAFREHISAHIDASKHTDLANLFSQPNVSLTQGYLHYKIERKSQTNKYEVAVGGSTANPPINPALLHSAHPGR